MKVLLLSDTYSEHTEKWALGLAQRGVEIGLFSFNKASYDWYSHENITVFYEPENKINAESMVTKLAYLKYVGILKKIIKHFKPDVLHAHYATSYGLVGALCNFHPFVISSWGTDVMKFPNKNFVAKSLLKYNFKKADALCATSQTIKDCIQDIIQKEVSIIPFGIDLNQFCPTPVQSLFEDEDFVIGSIKPLETIYNIDVLIRSFANLHKKYRFLKLLIVGEGSEEAKLKLLVEEQQLSKSVVFTGRIPFADVNRYYNMLDVLVNISEYESFGVSVAEAMACGKPVVVTNVGGLNEIVKDNSVGLKVEVRNMEQTSEAIELLISDEKTYHEISANARKHISEHYNWKNNLDQMMAIYTDLIAKKGKEIDLKAN
ncbi:MAG: glycosyltransferase [bacterium]|nr:glycosyltransferase [bacterium]